jgi:hypothetical protein
MSLELSEEPVVDLEVYANLPSTFELRRIRKPTCVDARLRHEELGSHFGIS